MFFFFFNDTGTTEIYPLSLHDGLPISSCSSAGGCTSLWLAFHDDLADRSEEHTSELQSPYVISYAVFCLKKKHNMRLQRWHCIRPTPKPAPPRPSRRLVRTASSERQSRQCASVRLQAFFFFN